MKIVLILLSVTLLHGHNSFCQINFNDTVSSSYLDSLYKLYRKQKKKLLKRVSYVDSTETYGTNKNMTILTSVQVSRKIGDNDGELVEYMYYNGDIFLIHLLKSRKRELIGFKKTGKLYVFKSQNLVAKYGDSTSVSEAQVLYKKSIIYYQKGIAWLE
jgi:hypothetical protein